MLLLKIIRTFDRYCGRERDWQVPIEYSVTSIWRNEKTNSVWASSTRQVISVSSSIWHPLCLEWVQQYMAHYLDGSSFEGALWMGLQMDQLLKPGKTCPSYRNFSRPAYSSGAKSKSDSLLVLHVGLIYSRNISGYASTLTSKEWSLDKTRALAERIFWGNSRASNLHNSFELPSLQPWNWFVCGSW